MLETHIQRQKKTPLPNSSNSKDRLPHKLDEHISLALVNSHLQSIHEASPDKYHVPKKVNESVLTQGELELLMAQLYYMRHHDSSVKIRYHADLALTHCTKLRPIGGPIASTEIEPLSQRSVPIEARSKVITDPTLRAKTYNTPAEALQTIQQTTIFSRIGELFENGSSYIKKLIQSLLRQTARETPRPLSRSSYRLASQFAAFATLATASTVAFFTMQPKTIDASNIPVTFGTSSDGNEKPKPEVLHLRSTGDLRLHLNGSGNGSIERGLKRCLINDTNEGNSILTNLYPNQQFNRAEGREIAGNIAHRVRQALGADIHAGASDKLVTLIDLGSIKNTDQHRFAIELGGKTHEVEISLPNIDRVLGPHPSPVITYGVESKPKENSVGYTLLTTSPAATWSSTITFPTSNNRTEVIIPNSIETEPAIPPTFIPITNVEISDKKKILETRNTEVNNALDELHASDVARAELANARLIVETEQKERVVQRSALKKQLERLVEQQQTLPRYRTR